MASWFPFGYTGQADTCKWCGRKLRLKSRHYWGLGSAKYKAESDIPAEARVTKRNTYHDGTSSGSFVMPGDRRGDYHDGHFCGLRCGYEFAVQFADRGHILEVTR